MRHIATSPVPLAALIATAALGLGACSPADNSAEPAATVTETTAETSTTTATTEASVAAPATTTHVAATDEEAASAQQFTTARTEQPMRGGPELVINDIRLATHDGFDRVVFEYAGPGLPGFIVGYTPEPRQQASGHLLEVVGNAYLEVMIQGTPMGLFSPDDELNQPGPMNRAAGTVQGITHGAVFEADSQYVIGLDQERPFHAYTLENPPRVVVDIQR
ncbi:hypothetical protein [Corynebacterium timonense]|uniref:AMIN-like domain-containing protein n=1 Tax=Corynebacterium timonense TaxID=441500 RepID=A0A1H1N5Q5_9CORY|nr:hypothetical protein [Corynebacterium timonense]SDR94294.1 hypothetical protein SAMN04488539_0691 [Corynebacterium timonense]